MKKYEALGIIETQYFAVATELLDSVCKASNVEFLTSENYLGGRLVTIIVGGSISDVTVAIETAQLKASEMMNNPLKMAIVITNPHKEIMKYIIPSLQEEAAEEDVPQAKKQSEKKRKQQKL